MTRHSDGFHFNLFSALAAATIAGLALAAAMPVSAQEPADAGADVAETDGPRLECAVSAYDVVIRNTGEVTVPEGTEAEWAVQFARVGGIHTLKADLEPEAFVVMAGAMGINYLVNDEPCEISIL